MSQGNSFNAFQIKRQAHGVSRLDEQSPADTWNPFRHVWASRGHSRTHTWDVEARRFDIGLEEELGTSPIEHQHAHTAPTPNPSRSHGVEEGKTRSSLKQVDSDGNEATCSDHEDTGGARNRKKQRDSPTPSLVFPRYDSEVEPKKKRGIFKTVQPIEPFTVANQIQRTLLGAWINVLLLAVPAGIIANYLNLVTVAVFVINLVAIFPLYFMTSFAMTEIELRLGPFMSGFLSISASNLFQLISCILLLVHDQIAVLKLSLAGGILSNILFLLGLGILFGGWRRPKQMFNELSAHTSSVMLSLASTSLLIPTACYLLSQTSSEGVIKQSRGVSVVLIFIYCFYLRCSLGTHYDRFAEQSAMVSVNPSKHSLTAGAVKMGLAGPVRMMGVPGDTDGISNTQKMHDLINAPPPVQDEEDECDPQLDIWVAIAVFLICAALLFFCSDGVVNSINGLVQDSGLSSTFVGLILLPLPNCESEPVTVAIRGNLDGTLNYTVNKSIQTALLVLPGIILLGWCLGKDEATLVLDGFEVVSIFSTVILLNLIMGKNESIWVLGVLLLGDWILIAVAAFFVD